MGRDAAPLKTTSPTGEAMIDRFSQLSLNGTNVRTEIIAGATTYLTMAYIVFVNPVILANAGMDRGAVFVATCLASALATLLMALLANYPLALAPGMGINAYFAYSVVKGLHYSWEVALGAVFLSGVLFLIISVTPIRAWIVDAIPRSQKMAISAGIGLFLGIIALKDAGIVIANPETLVTLGDLKAPAALLAAAGFLVMVALERRAFPGAIIVAVLGTAAAGILLQVSPFFGIVAAPPSLAPTFLALDLRGALDAGVATIVFVFLFVDLFDNTGTLIGVAHRAGRLD
ncbi:MAG TPA: NCS2 family permease, partial [Stellaceae bacterium]